MKFALNCEKIRLFTLEGSRTNTNIPKDDFQDYDFSYFVTDFPERESLLLQRWDDSEVETGVSLDTLMFQLFCSLNERIL
jgi:hypothetical protein